MPTRRVRARGACPLAVVIIASVSAQPGVSGRRAARGLPTRRGQTSEGRRSPPDTETRVPNRRGPRRVSWRARGGAGRPHKGSVRPGFRAGAPPRAAQAPPRASLRPRRRRPREPSRDAPHCLRGGCSPRASAARARNPAVARAPAPASRSRRPLLSPARPVRSDEPRQPRAPARRLPAERRRPARARDSARGGARPRGCVGPARPGPAGPWTGQCPCGGGVLARRGARPALPALPALETGHRPPVPLPAWAYSAARPCQPATLALSAPEWCPAPPSLVGDPACPALAGSFCRAQRFRVSPSLPGVPRTARPRPSERRVAGGGRPF